MVSVRINYIELNNSGNHKKILHDIFFNLYKGNIYTILGKNGSGKTTLISALTGLLDQNIYSIEASIDYEGKNLLEMNHSELLHIRKDKIKYVLQDSINGFDHLRKFEYYFRLSDNDDNEISELFDYFLLPEKDKIFGMFPYEVSGGMAQRISMCLALLAKPDLLILDEPTSAVDINISNLLCIKLRDFTERNNSSVLMITQDMDFAEQVSDYMAHLDGGTLSKFYNASDYKQKFPDN